RTVAPCSTLSLPYVPGARTSGWPGDSYLVSWGHVPGTTGSGTPASGSSTTGAPVRSGPSTTDFALRLTAPTTSMLSALVTELPWNATASVEWRESTWIVPPP